MAATGNEFVKLQQFKTAMDSQQPDMTGIVRIDSNGYLENENQKISQIHVTGVSGADTIIGSAGPAASTITAMGQSSAQVVASNGNDIAALLVTAEEAFLKIGSKSVSSITDAIADSPSGAALVTDKAVADYIKSLVATDEEFDTFMGLS